MTALIKHHIQSNNSINAFERNVEHTFDRLSLHFNLRGISLALSVEQFTREFANCQLYRSVTTLHLQLHTSLHLIHLLIDSVHCALLYVPLHYQASCVCPRQMFKILFCLYLLPENFSCLNKTHPMECLAGSYAMSGSTECQPCPKGAFCPTKGLPMYHLCANGTYSDMEGLSYCKLCDTGSRCPSVGMEAPEECPNGTYSNTIGARYCVLCPEGHR